MVCFTHTIHLCYIYLHLWLIFLGFHVGKYTEIVPWMVSVRANSHIGNLEQLRKLNSSRIHPLKYGLTVDASEIPGLTNHLGWC